MAIREIVTFPDERLRQICAPVTEFDAALKELTDDMKASDLPLRKSVSKSASSLLISRKKTGNRERINSCL